MQAWISDRPGLLGALSPLLLLNFILAVVTWIAPRMAAIPTLHMCWPNQNLNQSQSRNQNQNQNHSQNQNQKQKQKQRRRTAPAGLRNLGNSCYLNSVLQCLTHTPPLANFCLNSLHSSKCTVLPNSGGNSNCPFCLLEKHIYRSLTIDAAVETPARIHNSLTLFAKHFRSGRQEDAHEFLRYVVEACNKVCVKAYNIQNGIKSSGKQGEEPHTVVKEIFGGVLQNQVKCLTCHGESNKRDAIMDLSLDICNCSSLKEAMCHFFQPEILDGNNKYRCEKCKKLSAARKQMLVYQAPNVLVVQLKRFENMYGGKITRHVQFDDQLELAGYMCKASQDPVPEYALYGVIVHVGFTQEGGHYYSYVKDSNGKWFCCNDALVSPADAPTLFAEKAYMLFYIRTNAKPKMAKDNHAISQNGHVPNTKSSLSENQKNAWKGSALPKDSNRNTNKPPLKFSVSRTINGQASKHTALNGYKKTLSWPGQHKQQSDQATYPGSVNGNGNCFTVENSEKVASKRDQRFDQEMEANNHLMLPLIANSSSCMSSTQNMNAIASTRKELTDSEPSTATMVKNISGIRGTGKIALNGDNFSSEELRYYSTNGGCQSMTACSQNGSERVSKMAHHWQSGSYVISRDKDSTPNKIDKTSRCFQAGDPDYNQSKALSNGLPHSASGYSSSSKAMETGNTLPTQNSVPVEKRTCGKKRYLSDTYTVSVIGNGELGRGLQTDASVLAGLCHCLEKEAREWLQEYGWTDTVRESMRAAKRSKNISRVNDAESSKDCLREELIGKVQDEMTQRIPNEVEGHLRALLQYFFTHKK